MERFWCKAEITPAGRPVMKSDCDELTLTTQHSVGLYFGSERLKTHDDGTLYVTTHRLIWIPSSSMSSASAIYLPLSSVLDIDTKPGFLTSHPKITLTVSEMQQAVTPEKNDSTLLPKWICTTCSMHVTVSLKSCSECGVPRSNDAHLVCHKCTYYNPPSVKECQMCVTIFTSFSNLTITQISQSSFARASFRLSFREGGYSAAQQALESARNRQAWLKESMKQANSASVQTTRNSEKGQQLKPVGVSGIMQVAQENQKQTDTALSNAFEDLESLMKKAAEMVKLAESIKTKVVKSNDENKNESSEFQTYLLDLGISSHVTKEMTGSQYYVELSKQLCDFIAPLFPKLGPILLLTDVYCLYNRARGVSLVSPDDLLRAASLLETISTQMSLKKFSTGVFAIQSASFHPEEGAKRIQSHLDSSDVYITVMDVMDKEKVTRPVASEMLEAAERNGWVCRDETLVQGVRYYKNLFLEPVS